jgi:hypothetical protein
MPKDNTFERVLFLLQLAQRELEVSKVPHLDTVAQLAYLRLGKACEALEGKIEMEEFERKILSGEKTGKCQEVWIQRSVPCENEYGHVGKCRSGPYQWDSKRHT